MKPFIEKKRQTDSKNHEGYCRMPKSLFTDPRYKDISTEAKVLYTLMLDRLSLSKKNGWLDQEGNTYIIFSMRETMELLDVGHEKAVKLFAMLDQDKGIGLIRRKKLGQGRPARIYVQEMEGFDTTGNNQNQNSGEPENRSQNFRKQERNKINNNKNNRSNQSINPDDTVEKNRNLTEEVECAIHYEEIVKSNIEQDVLMERHPFDQATIQGITDLITDTVTSRRKTIRLDCQDVPQELVKSRFLKLNFCHIEYILEQLSKNITRIRNFRSYLLTSLYNAPATISGYYSAAVAYDMATGFI